MVSSPAWYESAIMDKALRSQDEQNNVHPSDLTPVSISAIPIK